MSKDKQKTYEELCIQSTIRDPNTGKLVRGEAEIEKPAEIVPAEAKKEK